MILQQMANYRRNKLIQLGCNRNEMRLKDFEKPRTNLILERSINLII